jgi:7-cyano-7-deazaguanine synthase
MMQSHRAGGVLVLLSGGIDSTACVHYYKQHATSVHALHVNYGQAAAAAEQAAASAISQRLGIALSTIKVDGFSPSGAGVLIGRNHLLLSVALFAVGEAHGILALGIHAGTAYVDCSPTFADQAQRMLDLLTDGRVALGVPFLNSSKRDIWRYCVDNSLQIADTYSCEAGTVPACGTCLSCADRAALR